MTDFECVFCDDEGCCFCGVTNEDNGGSMTEFNIEDLDEVIYTAESSLVQMLALQLKMTLRQLEIALPILEQQEQGDGWIEWGGGEQPVADDVIVKVTCRGGDRFGPDSASCFEWEHYVPGPDGYDIIAYRIIPEQPTNQNGEQ